MEALYQCPFRDLRFNELNDFSTLQLIEIVWSKISIDWAGSVLSKQLHLTPNQNTFPLLAILPWLLDSSLHLRGQRLECADQGPVWSDSFSFISNIRAMGDFTFKQRVSDDFSTFPKCGMFQLHQDAEYLIVIINRRVCLRNCWLFISNEVSPLSRNPAMIHH